MSWLHRIASACSITCVLLLGSGWPLAVTAQEIAEGRPAEFMIYQYPEVTLLIRIEVPETSFEAEITGPENALLKESGLPEHRLGPVYQLVDAVDSPRQLMIKITPERAIERDRISLELVQLSVFDRNSQALARAYKHLSYGAERVHDNDSSTWASKAYSFRSAAQEFASLGMEKMRLWSEYFAAHLVLHRLNDEQTALEFAAALDRSARRAGFDELELATLTLRSEALQQAAVADGDEAAGAESDLLHEVLQRRADLAARLSLPSEQARALFSDAAVHEREGRLDAAIRRFGEALTAAEDAANLELANEIRSAAATVYESQGRTEGAIEMLEGIRSEDERAAADDTMRDVADSLFERGRLLNREFRYREAAAILREAMGLRQSGDSGGAWGPVGLELGWAHLSLGDMDEASRVIEASLPRTPRPGNAAALARAYDSLARISRYRGAFDAMERYRELQADYVTGGPANAAWQLERALDARRALGPGAVETRRALQESRRLANRQGDWVTAWRTTLYSCLATLGRSPAADCSQDARSTARASLAKSGFPRWAVESAVLDARLSLGRGDAGQAGRLLDRVVEDIRFYQSSLPGALGAWYWENRASILRDFLSVAVARPDGAGRSVLLALESIRRLEQADIRAAIDPVADPAGEPGLRNLLARRQTAVGEEGGRLAAQLNPELVELRRRFDAEDDPFDANDLERSLAGLGPDTSVVTWVADDDALYGVLADRNGVRIEKLGGVGDIGSRLDRVLGESGEPLQQGALRELDALGARLLGPFERRLAEFVYVVPAGPLNGFPVEALRLGGRWLAERHQVIHLGSLDALGRAAGRSLPSGEGLDRVFLAGNPRQDQQLFSYGISTSDEIAAVRDRFIGPGLHIVQGVALQRDEFADERFRNAELVHLSMPGSIDLAAPERSRLLLSSTDADDPDRFLAPSDLRGFDLSARLVVLSGAVVTGRSLSIQAIRRGFVSDFLEMGTPAVLATLWPLEDAEAAAFMSDFYARLASGSTVSDALSAVRRERIVAGEPTNFGTWAGFQLHIR
ncbi:MAG: CHAT domain-containing protein [Gammaproteobacteria bacterium]|nr:CHAT domain-containing protein [Gammaproteobacteria bacterium]